MKIKHQFIILTATIIAIPLVCTLYMAILHYLRSPDRVMISGSKKIIQVQKQMEKLTTEEQLELRKTMRLLPQGVQAALVDDDRYVLYSTIPEITLGSNSSDFELWRLMNRTSDTYFYQVSTPNIRNSRTILITRVSKIKGTRNTQRRFNIFWPLIYLLIIFVCFCIILILLTSKNIFKSVNLVESTTGDLASGKLETKIQISDRNNEITSTLNNLEQMRKSLLEAQNRKNKFIMGISHDLRTPVAVIKGYTEAIHDGVISEHDELIDTVELIQGKTAQLESMIDSLISYTKMQSSELKEKLHKASITNLIKDFAKGAEITGGIYNRKIITDIRLPEDFTVMLDEQLVSRLFENLYSNAIRYSKENDTISIISYQEDNKILLKVQDTGIGISEEDLKNIFDLFYRGTNSRREEGMGIGLSVVKNITEIHGWEIEVESEKGKGSCFTVIIPLKG